jgi:hypothetical protein
MSSLNKNEDLWFARSEKIQIFLRRLGVEGSRRFIFTN